MSSYKALADAVEKLNAGVDSLSNRVDAASIPDKKKLLHEIDDPKAFALAFYAKYGRMPEESLRASRRGKETATKAD